LYRSGLCDKVVIKYALVIFGTYTPGDLSTKVVFLQEWSLIKRRSTCTTFSSFRSCFCMLNEKMLEYLPESIELAEIKITML